MLPASMRYDFNNPWYEQPQSQHSSSTVFGQCSFCGCARGNGIHDSGACGGGRKNSNCNRNSGRNSNRNSNRHVGGINESENDHKLPECNGHLELQQFNDVIDIDIGYGNSNDHDNDHIFCEHNIKRKQLQYKNISDGDRIKNINYSCSVSNVISTSILIGIGAGADTGAGTMSFKLFPSVVKNQSDDYSGGGGGGGGGSGAGVSVVGGGVSGVSVGGIVGSGGGGGGIGASGSAVDLTIRDEDDAIWNCDHCYFDKQTNYTPSLSQVLLAPTSPTGPGGIVTGVASNNATVDELNSFYFYETEQLTVLWVLLTVIVLGNSAVLVTLFLNKNRKSRMNFFIKQLAVADLFVGLLNVLTDIIWRLTVSWRAGNIACKLIRFLQACVTYASTYVLVALSIDRYDAITHPMNFSGSWRRARRLVAAAWALSAVFSVPIIYLYEEKLIQGQTQCWIELGEPWRWQLYMSLVSAALFVFPAFIISACYAIILRTIWAKGAILGPSGDRRGGIDRGSRRASSRGIIPRAKVKTVKMTIVIVIVFVLCWSPYIIFDLLQVFGQIPRTQTNIAIATFIQSLAPLNSAANPLIYCLFSTQVCRALRRMPPFRWLASTWCCKSHTENTATVRCAPGHHGPRLNNSSDSMRTLTTSLTVSRRSCMRPARVVIVERPKTILAMSEV